MLPCVQIQWVLRYILPEIVVSINDWGSVEHC